MKQKKVLSRLISAFVAVIMLIGIMPIISSADDGVILSYTFDTEDTQPIKFSDVDAEQTLYKYDGKDFTFLRALEISDSVWNCGWFNYDTDRKGVSKGVPTHNETFVNDGELHIKLAKKNYLGVRIPGAEPGKMYNVSLNVSGIDGNGLSILVDNNNGRPGGKPQICSTNIGNLYSGNFDYQSGDFIKIENTTDGNLSFAIDNLLIKKCTPATATVTDSMPASGTKNVSTYIKPSVTFDNYVTDDIVNGIEVYADNKKINAAITKSADSKTVYVAPAEPLPGNTNIEIRIPNNSPVTFTTDDEGVLLHYTFDSKKSDSYPVVDNNNTYNYDLYSYDGKDHTFLRYKEGCANWYIAWLSGNDDTHKLPTTDNIDIDNGKLKLNFNGNFKVKLPSYGTEGTKYSIEFKVSDLKGKFGDILIDNENGVHKEPLTAGSAVDGATAYKGVFTLVNSNDFLYISSNGTVSCYLDDLIVKKYVESPVSIAGTFPEQNRENVPVYVNPEVTFDNVVTTDYANGIKILNGTDEIETTKTLSSDGKTVTLKTSSQLPANSLITVKADGNNSFTFTTGDRNVALFEDFETGTNEDEKFGTIYGVNKLWGSDSVELTNCEQLGSRAIKLTNGQYGAASISLSPKICGDAANRRLKISFDCYTEGTAVEVKLDGTGREKGTKIVPTLKPGKSHIEVVIGLTYFWNGAVLFQNSGSEVTDIYVDNIRVEDVTENAWADIIYDNNNSLITAVAPKNEDGTFKKDERGFLCTTENVNQMWTGMSGETLTAKYNNLTDGIYKGYIAVYSGDTLIGASAADITVADGATDDTVVITLPAEVDTGALSVKAFLWNSEMTPIIEPTVLYNVK